MKLFEYKHIDARWVRRRALQGVRFLDKRDPSWRTRGRDWLNMQSETYDLLSQLSEDDYHAGLKKYGLIDKQAAALGFRHATRLRHAQEEEYHFLQHFWLRRFRLPLQQAA